jgi:hypothetical protein
MPRFLLALALLTSLAANELHVSVKGNDANPGSASAPLRTISAAARLAQPGDTITVHEGVYRERITPPRGGESDAKRIVYQSAPGEKAVIKGSEVVRDWKQFAPGVWKAAVPLSVFGSYNPYKDLIQGDWFTGRGRPHHTGEVYLNGKALFETHLLERVLYPQPFPDARDREASTWTWWTESDDKFTYIYANFHDKDPNRELVEINVRDAVFYPDAPRRDYITVRGFTLSHAATQWAAPTAEQIGLIGVHWSKGWVIENNVISGSKCTCLTLGKERKTGHNVWINEPAKDGATHYNEVIARALNIGWSKETIGSHVVRNNTIFNCGQAGIAGSMGAVFSEIYGNHIYNVWAERQFTGAEMAGIKLHGAIDVTIRHNRIHNAGRGLWMDWMTQGTRITGNLLYDNTTEDLFVEVNHGPFLVDNNVFLSPISLLDMSEGGAYAHNLFGGRIQARQELRRFTPYHRAHSTQLAGRANTRGGDNRFFNNIFLSGVAPAQKPGATSFDGYGLWVYDTRELPSFTGGNVYFGGARPHAKESSALTVAGPDPKAAVAEEGDAVYLTLTLGAEPEKAATPRVTSALLGKAAVPDLPYENADGTPLSIDRDFAGKARDANRPTPGPFEKPGAGPLKLKVW